MYKDRVAQREYNKERMRKARVAQKGSTDPGSTTTESVLPDEGQRLHPGAAPGARILSDGQLWYPGNKGYHPTGCQCGIKHND